MKNKNIHILQTDKPSKLYKSEFTRELEMTSKPLITISDDSPNQHIYITNDEEIKGFENNIWVYNNGRVWLWQNTMALRSDNKPKKIILTTDQDLIKDGVQAIDNKFLEWFVKNTSCEEVEVENYKFSDYPLDYKIIIPSEEPKPHSFCETPQEKCTMNYCDENGCQNRKRDLVEPKEEPKEETLEDYELRQLFKNRSNCYADADDIIQAMDENCFVETIKELQEEKMYSEEEVLNILYKHTEDMFIGTGLTLTEFQIKEWLEQFKKK